jgi:hypothetical protein
MTIDEMISESVQSPVVPGKVPTAEQRDIIAASSALRGKSAALVVEAGAGTGKTSTLVMIEEAMRGGIGQYTAFNKALVEESKAKFKCVACNTTHSLAFRAVGKTYSHRLNGGRVRSQAIADALGIKAMEVQVASTIKPKRLAASLLASWITVALGKFCQSADTEILWTHFLRQPIDLPGSDGKPTSTNNFKVIEYLLPFARKYWADISDPQGSMPFTHDYYVKIWQLGEPAISADYILLDEAQDTAPVMLDVLKRQKGLVIVVGDSAQQIYEWRGAVNAMTAFRDAQRLMLSQSFRFGPAIADLANRVLDRLTEKTPLRLKGLPSIDSEVCKVNRPAAILCRTNAAAVAHLIQAMGEGTVAPHLLGGGTEAVAWVEGAKCLQGGQPTYHPDLACFASWREVQEVAKTCEGEDLALMAKLVDKFGCGKILNALQAMPVEKAADLVISTAHKPKGREWSSVKLASDFPEAVDCDDADLRLLYVALTRAKLKLDVSECPFFCGGQVSNEMIETKGAVAVITETPEPFADEIASSRNEMETIETRTPACLPILRGGKPVVWALAEVSTDALVDELKRRCVR